jgi:uncharacterized protein
MRIRRRARLDPSQVSDRRGMSGSPIAIGGGAIGLIVAVVLLLLNGGLGGSPTGTTAPSSDLSSCRTGADAQQSQDCAVVAYVNSIQDYWSQTLPGYTQARTVLFTDRTQTGCGVATTAIGPFYCPADQHVYIDLGFFRELTTRFGASGGPLAQAYVLAHEYGHHVQDLQGTIDRGGANSQGPTSASVRLELQADCYAGVWANRANAQFQILQTGDVEAGLRAAAAVGDDTLEKESQGYAVPDSFTHGTSAQRTRWFKRGLSSGDMDNCDTFAAETL